MKRKQKIASILMAASMVFTCSGAMAASAETDGTWQYENCGAYIMITGGDTTVCSGKGSRLSADTAGIPAG